MDDFDKAPDFIVLDFFRSSLDPLKHEDLGEAFFKHQGVSSYEPTKQFRIAIEKRKSKAGNAYYDFSESSIPLPDGLDTYLRIEGVVIPLGKPRPSNNGNPTREGKASIVVGKNIYDATCYLTQGRSGFYVKAVATKHAQKN